MPMRIATLLKHLRSLDLSNVDLTRRHPELFRALSIFSIRPLKRLHIHRTLYPRFSQVLQLVSAIRPSELIVSSPNRFDAGLVSRPGLALIPGSRRTARPVAFCATNLRIFSASVNWYHWGDICREWTFSVPVSLEGVAVMSPMSAPANSLRSGAAEMRVAGDDTSGVWEETAQWFLRWCRSAQRPAIGPNLCDDSNTNPFQLILSHGTSSALRCSHREVSN